MNTKDDQDDGLTDSERAVLAGLDDSDDDLGALRDIAGAVSYTHLTLPTKRIV